MDTGFVVLLLVKSRSTHHLDAKVVVACLDLKSIGVVDEGSWVEEGRGRVER